MTKPYHTSGKDDWETPQYVFDYAFDRWGPFNLDGAAQKCNTKCKEFLSDATNFTAGTGDFIWLNPPYSKNKQFIALAEAWAEQGAQVCCLVPSRTDTVFFQEAAKTARIYLIKGRINFVGGKHTAPFPSCFILFGYGEPGIWTIEVPKV